MIENSLEMWKIIFLEDEHYEKLLWNIKYNETKSGDVSLHVIGKIFQRKINEIR